MVNKHIYIKSNDWTLYTPYCDHHVVQRIDKHYSQMLREAGGGIFTVLLKCITVFILLECLMFCESFSYFNVRNYRYVSVEPDFSKCYQWICHQFIRNIPMFYFEIGLISAFFKDVYTHFIAFSNAGILSKKEKFLNHFSDVLRIN